MRLEAESKKAKLEAQEKERLRSQLVNLSSLSRPPAVRQSSSGSVHSQVSELSHSTLVCSELIPCLARDIFLPFHSHFATGRTSFIVFVLIPIVTV